MGGQWVGGGQWGDGGPWGETHVFLLKSCESKSIETKRNVENVTPNWKSFIRVLYMGGKMLGFWC